LKGSLIARGKYHPPSRDFPDASVRVYGPVRRGVRAQRRKALNTFDHNIPALVRDSFGSRTHLRGREMKVKVM
jgi:hypothetical protein